MLRAMFGGPCILESSFISDIAYRICMHNYICIPECLLWFVGEWVIARMEEFGRFWKSKIFQKPWKFIQDIWRSWVIKCEERPWDFHSCGLKNIFKSHCKQSNLIFVFFLQTQFLVSTFSTQERINRHRTDFTTKKCKLLDRRFCNYNT